MALIFDPQKSTISKILIPQKDNPRSSEGDFIRLRDGRILFAFSYYHGEDWNDHARCDIRALYSDDDGATFYTSSADGTPHLLITAETYGEKNVMSVSLCRMANGDLGLFYLLKHANLTDELLLSRSADEGASFYETVSVLPGVWRGYYVVNNCRVERLTSGRLLVPAAYHPTTLSENGMYDGRSVVYFHVSDDDGRTWQRLPARLDMPALSYSSTGLQEPGVLELPNGDLYAYMRTDVGCQYEALSPDGGTHWFGVQPSRFTSPPSPLKLARNPYTGRYYAVWNPIPNYAGRENAGGAVWGRTPLVLAQSTDGYNYDIANAQIIEDDPARGFCYPALFFPDADTLLLAYCSGGAEDGACLCRLTIRRIPLLPI